MSRYTFLTYYQNKSVFRLILIYSFIVIFLIVWIWQPIRWVSLSGSSSAHWQLPSRSRLSAAQGLRFISSLCFSSQTLPFSRRETLSWSPPLLQIFLPWRQRLGERRPSPLPATSASPPGMPLQPLLFPCAVRDGALQTLIKLSVFGSESSYNIEYWATY